MFDELHMVVVFMFHVFVSVKMSIIVLVFTFDCWVLLTCLPECKKLQKTHTFQSLTLEGHNL